MFQLRCVLSDRATVMELCEQNYLDIDKWKLSEESHFFLLFYDCNRFVGAVECSVNEEWAAAYIEMLEVVEPFRCRGYGYSIVKQLQQEFFSWRCTPIPASEALFRKCGFKKWNGPIWAWDK